MERKGLAAVTALAALLAAGTASAGHGKAYGVAYARVVDVQPIVRQVLVQRPRRECWQVTEYRSARPLGTAAPTIAGGIIGAAIGRQFGGGSGRDALTLIGAVAGSAVANERARRNQARRGEALTYAVPVERCAVTTDRVTQQVVDGYWVTYRYRGQRHRIRTLDHPGDRIRLQISGRPVGYRSY